MSHLRSVLALAAMLLPLPALAEPPDEAGLGDNPKLDREVRIVAEGVPVGDLMAAIGKSARLSLRAEPAVADEKVIVLGPPRPLRAILMDIAALLNNSWRHYINVDGDPQLVLYREPRSVRYEEALARSVVDRMQARLDEQVRALDETPEQFAKRPANDWIRKNFAQPILHGRTATRLYGLLDSRQRDALFANGYLNVSFASSGTADQQTVRNAFKEAVAGLEKESERVQQENPNVHIVIDSPENLERAGIRFNLHHENNAGLSALVVQVVLGKASYMTVGEFDCDQQWLLPAHGNPYTRAPVVLDASLPAPKAAAPATDGSGWIDQIRKLSESAKCPVVADFYRVPALVKPLAAGANEAATGAAPAEPSATPPASPVAPAGGPAGGAVAANAASPGPGVGGAAQLDAFFRPSGYLWWMNGKTLLLRKRDWYNQRVYEVPDRWIRAVAARLGKENSVPTYGDLSLLLELTPRQIAGLENLLNGGGTPDDADTLAGLPELLELLKAATDPAAPIYEGSLSPQVATQIALPRQPAPPALRAHVLGFLAARRQITSPLEAARFRVCLTCYSQIPGTGAAEPATAHRPVVVVVEWNPGPSQTPYDQQLQLALPTTVPGERSSKTVVEVVQKASGQ
jgi:hypothetical protein